MQSLTYKLFIYYHIPFGLMALSTTLAGTNSAAAAAGQSGRVAGTSELHESRPFLRWERPAYNNLALQNFSNYENHYRPYDDSPRTYYGPMGDYLTTGYDLYFWEEVRTPGQVYGSVIFKPNEMYNHPWEKVYNSVAVMRDGYGGWGYSFIVGDNLIARFSPLTLSMTSFNGLRFDIATPLFKITTLASRIERPHTYQEVPTIWAIGRPTSLTTPPFFWGAGCRWTSDWEVSELMPSIPTCIEAPRKTAVSKVCFVPTNH